MAAEKGRLFLIKRGDGATSEVFTTIAGLRANSFAINGEAVDITNKDSNGFRELLEGAGTTSFSISGNGVFKNTGTELALAEDVIDKLINNYQIVFESGDMYTGAFQCTKVEYAGEHNKERTYNITLESSGEVTFVP